jgi:hypothetical protein
LLAESEPTHRNIRLLTLALSSLEEERKLARVAAFNLWQSQAEHIPDRAEADLDSINPVASHHSLRTSTRPGSYAKTNRAGTFTKSEVATCPRIQIEPES